MRRNKIKTIKTKILALVISSMLISTITVIFIAFSSYNFFMENAAGQIMQLLCTEKRQEIDEKLLNVEQTVHTLYHYAINQMGDIYELCRDEEAVEQHCNKIRELMQTAAEYTDGAVTVYYRFNPELVGSKKGIWLVREKDGRFYDYEVTDILQYSSDDVEHVGWYYVPVSRGEATWIAPYYNKNMSTEIISYVIPIFQGDTVVGVVGMDITTDLLYESTKAVTVYDSGYAFLMDGEGNFVYHPEMTDGISKVEFNYGHTYLFETSVRSAERNTVESYRWNDMDKQLTSQCLRNGMIFSVCVAEREIMQPKMQMIERTVLLISGVVFIFILVTMGVVRMMVSPLKELTIVAQKIANVDLDVQIKCCSRDEIGILAQSLKVTAMHLKDYIENINYLAYSDAQTGLKNKTAYKEEIERINERINKSEMPEFVVVVLDINNLKKVNDNYGHEQGDKLIQDAAAVVRTLWGSESVYRIGGDEFVVVKECDILCMQELLLSFEEEVKKYNEQKRNAEINLQVAVGISIFNEKTDNEYAEVFRRADAVMYEDKRKKKKIER